MNEMITRLFAGVALMEFLSAAVQAAEEDIS